ncbi:MAG: hypothetical protein M3N38_03820, partial [Pseudomonadota bacterium]|nr:hypothetical protein [Pseudomonadota bacterium]
TEMIRRGIIALIAGAVLCAPAAARVHTGVVEAPGICVYAIGPAPEDKDVVLKRFVEMVNAQRFRHRRAVREPKRPQQDSHCRFVAGH